MGTPGYTWHCYGGPDFHRDGLRLGVLRLHLCRASVVVFEVRSENAAFAETTLGCIRPTRTSRCDPALRHAEDGVWISMVFRDFWQVVLSTL